MADRRDAGYLLSRQATCTARTPFRGPRTSDGGRSPQMQYSFYFRILPRLTEFVVSGVAGPKESAATAAILA